jgi:hypothetical protein
MEQHIVTEYGEMMLQFKMPLKLIHNKTFVLMNKNVFLNTAERLKHQILFNKFKIIFASSNTSSVGILALHYILKMCCSNNSIIFEEFLFWSFRPNNEDERLVFLFTLSVEVWHCGFPSKIYLNNSWAQCYKTFFVGNLRTFVISQSVCPWQAFLVYSYQHFSLIRKYVNYR